VFRPKELLARLIAGTSLFPDLKDGLWLFIDRDILADDNAEQFYAFLESIGHHAPRHFVLAAASPDWPRLKQKRFQLIKYGSLRMHIACLRCSHLFSSQADAYVARMATLAKGRNRAARYIFLQHGILHHNLSKWLNARPVDLMVTSTRDERSAVCDPASGYRLAASAVVLTGLPRHDALLRKSAARHTKDCIILAPTWRKYLGTATGQYPEFPPSSENPRAVYFQRWRELLSSADLHAAADQLGCRIVLVLHHRMLGTQREFGNLRNVRVFRWGEDGSIQDLLCRTAVALTDYSSIVFDAALAGADIVYYQFDSGTFFSGAHSCRPGFFDYQRDGLGPVCTDPQQAGVVLRTIAEQGIGANPIFEGRKKTFFTFHDARNCERLLAQLASGTPFPA